MRLGFSVAFAAISFLAFRSEAPEPTLERCWAEVSTTIGPSPDCFLRHARSFAASALGERWERATDREKMQLVSALSSALRRGVPRDTDIRLRSRDSMRWVYHVGDGDEATLLLGRGDLLVRDVLWNGESLTALVREACDRYSLGNLVAELSRSGVVVLEDFEDTPIGEAPLEWKRRPFRAEVRTTPYRIVAEGENRFLRAEDRGENVMLYKEIRWDSKKYPYLAWRWRIRAVPAGADERVEDRADSAAGLYLSYGRKLGIVPETVKFVWSGSLAAGSAFRRPGIGMPWTVIAGSGAPEPDLWQSFAFHTGEVYRKTFGGEAGDRPLGVGLLSDADGTKSFAAADYDDIVALTRPRPADRVREIASVSTY
jgi:hypothetical protein